MTHSFRFAWLCAGLLIRAAAQDVAVVGGGGFAAGEESRTRAVSAVGASFGFPFESRRRVQFDYMFHRVRGAGESRGFFTGSYLVQGSGGRARPFFQVGAGMAHRRMGIHEKDASFAALLAAGATITLGERIFLRPQLRLYGHVGPTFTLLPALAVGWRF